jgi:hypothetical protein
MNGADNGSDVERLLKEASPAKSSAELKRRVLDAAGEAWVACPSPSLWRIAVRRLAVSAAAAVFIVTLANVWSNLAVARSRSLKPVGIGRESDAPLDEQMWADMEPAIPYASLLGRTAVAGRPMTGSAGTLLDHIQSLQDALSQMSIEE